VRRELEGVAIPGEDEATRRSLAVVQAAFAQRLPSPVPPSRRPRGLLVASLVAAAVVLGVAVSPAGTSLLHSVRQAVGLRQAAPALMRLPAAGRLLVDSGAGPWIVSADGSKRLLGRYSAATWSPHGLFEVAVRGRELAALDPKGTVRWLLARPGPVRDAEWSPDGYRIAYLSGSTLRVVAGDGTGDHVLARGVASIAPAWRPGADHVLAFETAAGAVRVANADSGKRLAKWPDFERPQQLLWSANGQYLLVLGRNTISLRTASLTRVESLITTKADIVAAAWAPSGERYALIAFDPAEDRTTVEVDAVHGRFRVAFTGTGRLSRVNWSPDGRWLVLGWPTADQWVFASTSGRRVLRAVGSISAQFDSRSFPQPAGWCC
jgi:WD40 repeat protein